MERNSDMEEEKQVEIQVELDALTAAKLEVLASRAGRPFEEFVGELLETEIERRAREEGVEGEEGER